MNSPRSILNEVTARFYDSFSNADDRTPDFSQFASLFVRDAAIGKRSESGVEIWSLPDFWAPRFELLTDGRLMGFSEWEVSEKTQVLGGMAIRQSHYEKKGLLDGQPYEGFGRKCFHFALTPDGWRIAFLLWEDDE